MPGGVAGGLGSLTPSFSYLPVEELDGRPHVLVDGATRPDSVLTLSHWPQSPTPKALARDLSAEIVFAFLHASKGETARGTGAGKLPARRSIAEVASAIAAAAGAEVVTNDHFDEDGLVSVFAMAHPEVALYHEDLLVDVASCGDFGVVRSRQAARIAFSICPIASEATRDSSTDPFAERPGSGSGPRYRAALEQMVELIEHPDHFQRYWQDDDAAFERSLEDLRTGAVRIEEVGGVDLAVVTRKDGTRDFEEEAVVSGGGGIVGCEVALHSTTPASRILTFAGEGCELYLRYEGWVRYVSRSVPLRPDLVPLAEQLTAAEPAGVTWRADGVGSLVTRMRPEPQGKSDLDPAMISRTIVSYLKSAPPAWDPFRRDGALIPARMRRLIR